MRTFPKLWLTTLLVLSATWDPMCVRGTEANTSSPRSPLTSQPAYSQTRVPSTPSSVRTAMNRHTRMLLAVPRKQDGRLPASYGTSQPQTLRLRPLTPTIKSPEGLGLGPFIGPSRQEYAKPRLSPNQGTNLVDASSPTSIFAWPRGNQLPLTMSAIPQQRENEYERMNDASHENIHGGN